jgi:hypothetical protein
MTETLHDRPATTALVAAIIYALRTRDAQFGCQTPQQRAHERSVAVREARELVDDVVARA